MLIPVHLYYFRFLKQSYSVTLNIKIHFDNSRVLKTTTIYPYTSGLTDATFGAHQFFNFFLYILQVLHLIWTFHIFRVAIKTLFGKEVIGLILFIFTGIALRIIDNKISYKLYQISRELSLYKHVHFYIKRSTNKAYPSN